MEATRKAELQELHEPHIDELLAEIDRLEQKLLEPAELRAVCKNERSLSVTLLRRDFNDLELRIAKRHKDFVHSSRVDELKGRLDKQRDSLLNASETIHKIKGRLDELEKPKDTQDFGQPEGEFA